jgi:uncharacterized lipoprotein YmbA
MRRPFAAVTVLGTVAAAISLVGCGGSSSTSPKSDSFKSLPAAEQASFEQAAVQEVEADVSSFTSFDPYATLFFNRVVPKRIGGVYAMARAKHTPQFKALQSNNCSATTGDLTDPDEDGVVNADTTTANCTITSGSTTITENGTFVYGDPTPNTADVDIADAANITFGETGTGDGDFTIALSGSGNIQENPGVLNETGNWALNEQITNQPQNDNGTFKLSAQETASYNFGSGTLVEFGTLPAGTFSVSGSWSYDIQTTNENINLSFSVTTPTPLAIDQTACTANSSGIESGEVDIKFADGTLVKAVWSGCPTTPSITVT